MPTPDSTPTHAPSSPAQQPAKQRDRTALTWADSFAVALTVAWILPEIIDFVVHGRISTRLSPAIEGGLNFAEFEPKTQAFFATAFAIKFIALLATVVLVTNVFTDMSKNRVFTERNSSRLTGAMISVFVFLFARLGLEGLANNAAAAELGIDRWWSDAGATTPLSEMAPAFMLACTLGALATILRRGAKLEEDVDGLV